MPSSELSPEFRVHPSVVLQLGAALITDRITAIVELVKNAYDADSAAASVTIMTHDRMDQETTFFPEAVGSIIIEDSGSGMDLEAIQRGWLTVSDSPKRDMKAKGQLTPGNRKPLGDKGLGRLGAQLLGQNLEIFTCTPTEQSGHHIGISWKDFSSVSDLSKVRVHVERIPKRKGTRLVISGLQEADRWVNDKSGLQRELSQVFFPFGARRPFTVKVRVDGERLDLTDSIDRIRDTAAIRYSFKFDGERLAVTGRYRLLYLKSQDNEEEYHNRIEADNGASLFSFLCEKLPGSVSYLSDRPGWFVQTEASWLGADKARAATPEGWANPGPFEGELDYFELRGGDINDVFDSRSTYKDFIKTQSGIRVYRDGFAIRPYGFQDGKGHDWLGLGKEATGGRSSYSLRVQNTVGFVSISEMANSQLKETTSREGFQDTPYSRNFTQLVSAVVDFTNQFNNQLRRGVNSFVADLQERGQNTSSPQKVRNLVGSAQPIEAEIVKLRARVDATLKAQAEIPTLHVSGNSRVQTVLAQVRSTLVNAQGLLTEIEDYLQRIKGLAADADSLELQLRVLRDQVHDFTELASLGLVAEAFSHELRNVADALEQRTKDVTSHLKTLRVSDPLVSMYLRSVMESLTALRKELSHLTPALRYVRERKAQFDVKDFLRDQKAYYESRANSRGIRYVAEYPEEAFGIRMSRGKLTQVLDNLVLNSEYWLRLMEGGPAREIHMEAKPPFIRVWDTGYGVDPVYEGSLFQPFVTGKPEREGRGLGLFIVQQLLDSDGCRIALLPQRNASGRRYIFQIDLSGVCTNGQDREGGPNY